MRSPASICSTSGSTIRSPNLSWRYGSIRISRRRAESYGVALAYCGRWEEGASAARQALRFSPRDPFAAIYCGVASYCQYVGRNYAEAIRLSREAVRQRSDFVGVESLRDLAASLTTGRRGAGGPGRGGPS